MDEKDIDTLLLSRRSRLYKTISNLYNRDSIFDYKIFLRDDDSQNCNYMAWFALSRDKADYYHKKASDTTIYTYRILRPIKLFIVNTSNNLDFFIITLMKKLKTNSQDFKCILSTPIPEKYRDKFQNYEYPRLTLKDRIIYEYGFAFGFLTTDRQLEFLKFILKLQEYNIIPPLNKIFGKNIFLDDSLILRNLRNVINFKQYILPESEVLKGQRFSIYAIDCNVLNNLCMLFSEHFDGYMYMHEGVSKWHKNMNDTTEIALFNTPEVLER